MYVEKTVLQVPCQNVQWIGSNTALFNMLSISCWIPICTYSVMSLLFPRLSAHCWCLAALVSSTSVSLLSVCLFNMQRRSFRESFRTSVNESATMISWRCRGSVHHCVSAFGDHRSSLRSSLLLSQPRETHPPTPPSQNKKLHWSKYSVSGVT